MLSQTKAYLADTSLWCLPNREFLDKSETIMYNTAPAAHVSRPFKQKGKKFLEEDLG